MLTHIGHIELFYDWINFQEEGPVMLFLHEGLGSTRQWKGFPEKMCGVTGFTGLVYDRQGHGQSSALTEERNETYLEKYALEELPAFIESVAPNRDLILFDHSDGGTIALIYASKYPDKIKAILTEAAHIYVEPKTWKGIEPVVAEFEKKTGFYQALENYHGDKTEQTFYAWSNTWHRKDQNNWNVQHYLKDIEQPCLLLQGADDQYATQKHLIDIQMGISGTTLGVMLRNCRHTPHEDQTEEVIGLVKEFLTSVQLLKA